MIYCDTSFLASLYVTDANTSAAIDLVNERSDSVDFSIICEFELKNAIRLAVFRKQISSKRATEAFSDITSDQKSGFLIQARSNISDAFSLAERISSKHTANLGNRTMDTLHIAFALAGKRTEFYTFDKRQAKLAKELSLNIHPK